MVVKDDLLLAGIVVAGLLGAIMYNNYRFNKNGYILQTSKGHEYDHYVNCECNPYYKHRAIQHGIVA